MKKTDNKAKGKATILPPDGRLKSKLGTQKLESIVTGERILMAQNAAITGSAAFIDDMTSKVAELEAAYKELSEAANPAPALHKINSLAFTIKSDAGMFGLSLAGDIAKLLTEYSTRSKSYDPFILSNLISSLKSICSGQIIGDGGETGHELLISLRKLIAKRK